MQSAFRITFFISIMVVAFAAVFPPLYYVILPQQQGHAWLYSSLFTGAFGLSFVLVFKPNEYSWHRLTLRDLNLLPILFLLILESCFVLMVISAMFAVFATARHAGIESDIGLPLSMLVIAITLPACVMVGAAWTRFGELFTLRFPNKKPETLGDTLYMR